MYLALRKYKTDCKRLKTILVQHLWPLKPETARFSIKFRLNFDVNNPFTSISKCLKRTIFLAIQENFGLMKCFHAVEIKLTLYRDLTPVNQDGNGNENTAKQKV